VYQSRLEKAIFGEIQTGEVDLLKEAKIREGEKKTR